MSRRNDVYVLGFSERLRDAVNKKGLSDSEVSKRIGLQHGAVCGYINYNQMPTCKTLARLSQVLEVSTDYLLGLKA